MAGGTAGTVAHDGVGATVVVVGAGVVVVVVVVGAMVDGVAHGSTGAGARSTGAGLGTDDGVGAGVVVGCANAPAVPEIIIAAIVLAVNNDRAAERVRRPGGCRGLDEIVMDSFFLSERLPIGPHSASLTKPHSFTLETANSTETKQTRWSADTAVSNRTPGLGLCTGLGPRFKGESHCNTVEFRKNTFRSRSNF